MTAFLLADDFTGAHDVGLPFVRQGLTVVTVAGVDHMFTDVAADVVIVDTGSRDCSAQEATRRVRAACEAIRRQGAALFYKKIDSTIRGHIGQELDIVHEVFGHAITLFVPAFPEMGRTTVGGYHLLHGVPVDRTGVADDPGAPARSGYLPDLIGRQSRQAVAHIDLRTVLAGPQAVRNRIDALAQAGSVIIVIDAASREAMDAIVEAARSMRATPALCGSAGLAYSLAAGLTPERVANDAPVPPRPPGPVLVIAGSIHPVTAQQIETAARRPEISLYRLDSFALLSENDQSRQDEIERAVTSATGAIGAGRHTILALAPPSHTDRKSWLERLHAAGSGRNLVAQLAEDLGIITERILPAAQIGGLTLTGGETAEHVVRRLGGRGTRIVGAVEDGIAHAAIRGGRFDGLPVVVKPGAFGGPETLLTAIAALRKTGRVTVQDRPVLGLTIGDPNGVGPEIIAKTLARPEVYEICRPLVIGHSDVMRRDIRFAGQPLEIHTVSTPEEGCYRPGIMDVLNVEDIAVDKLIPGTVQEAAGRLAVESVIRATHLAMEGRIQAVVTAPLNKEAMNLAGYHYAGHTELLADLTGTKKYRLTLATDGMLVSHVTTHVSLRQAIERLSEEGILATIDIIGQALKRMGLSHPRIAVCGLNPHAGEGGMFGDEEIRIIAPALEKARAAGWNILGPLPPDTVFMRARGGEFDGIVGMYHDQGHIPVKAVAFDRSVNVTLGLPIIRTSVDHGTAFDIAGQGIARAENMDAAIRMAVRLVGGR